jgi:uracil-DNA glycosylase
VGAVAAAAIDGLSSDAPLAALRDAVSGCTRCPLSQTRTQVVFGSGSPTADLMFVGEAPGFHEDKQGVPFVGQAGKLLDNLLGEIGLSRPQVYIANVLKCRPPGNRDPLPDEIAACEGHLFKQVELIQPRVICTLGNFATKLLTGRPHGITRVRGQAQAHRIAGVELSIYPIFHPAAALYTPAMLQTLRDDFSRLPALLAQRPAVEAPLAAVVAAPPVAEPEPEFAQLGLF